MPITHHRRAAPCSHCGDVVLVGERRGKTLYGLAFMRRADPKTTITQEHADPGPNGETFDPVDEGCRRPPVG